MATSLELPPPKPLTVSTIPDFPNSLDTIDYSGPLSAAYQLLDQAKKTLLTLRDEAAKMQASLYAVESDLKLLLTKEEEGEIAIDMSLSSQSDAIDCLFTQVKKGVFLADAQIDRFCFKQKSAYSDRERKKAVTSALEKMANDIWTALIAAMHKPALVHMTEARQAVASIRVQATALSKGLAASLESIEEVLYGHLKKDGEAFLSHMETAAKFNFSPFDTLKSAQSPQEIGFLHSGKEELAAELQEDGLRMLASFEKFARARGGRSNRVTAVRKEMNNILKDMVSAVKSHCEGLGPSADAETWKMKKQAIRIKNRIASLCRDLEDGGVTSVCENSMGRDMPSLDAGWTTPSFDSPDRIRSTSLDPPAFHSNSTCEPSETSSPAHVLNVSIHHEEPRGTRSRSERVRLAVAQVHSFHARQEAVLVDIANIRSKMNRLFPVSRLPTTLPSLSLLKTLAPELAVYSDHEFIELFAQQISTERREVADFLSSLASTDRAVPSLSAASSEFLRLHDSLQSLQKEHNECRLQTDRDKTLLNQLQTARKAVAASQTLPITLSIETVEAVHIATAACSFTLSEEVIETEEITFQSSQEIELKAEIPEIIQIIDLQIQGKTVQNPRKGEEKSHCSYRKGTQSPSRLAVVQEDATDESMDQEEVKMSSPGTELKATIEENEGKSLVRLPMSCFKAKTMSRDLLSVGKIASPTKIGESVSQTKAKGSLKPPIFKADISESRRNPPISPSKELTSTGNSLSPVSKSATPTGKTAVMKGTEALLAVKFAVPKGKSLISRHISELKSKQVTREPVLRRSHSETSEKSAFKAASSLSKSKQREITVTPAVTARKPLPAEASAPQNPEIDHYYPI